MKLKQNTDTVSASLAYFFQHVYKYVDEAETILKLFQCFISVSFNHVRRAYDSISCYSRHIVYVHTDTCVHKNHVYSLVSE